MRWSVAHFEENQICVGQLNGDIPALLKVGRQTDTFTDKKAPKHLYIQ